jgi:RNA polymerase sigma-B factor
VQATRKGCGMRIDVRRLGNADLVIASGAVDLATTARLQAVLDARVVEGRTQIVLDLRRVSLLDAGAVGMLAGVASRVERAEGRLCAINASGISLEALRIAGLDKRLNVYDEPAHVLERYGPRDVDEPDEDSGWLESEVTNLAQPAARWPGSRDITARALLSAATLDVEEWVRTDLRTQVIEDHMGLARRLARRFRDRGEPMEDLTQVAALGLVNAVDGYDPARGCEFIGYATPTIVGEIRRYFRDKGWRIKVPRRLQELRIRVSRAKAELSQTMSAEPTVAELAAYLGIDPHEVNEAIDAARVYQPASLSAPAGPGSDLGVADLHGDDDPGIEAVDNREAVKPLLAALPERERRILALRYFGELTQAQIAEELGISQMHVSRLLNRTLGTLRAQLAA